MQKESLSKWIEVPTNMRNSHYQSIINEFTVIIVETLIIVNNYSEKDLN